MKSKRIRIIGNIYVQYIYNCTADEFNKKYGTDIKHGVTINAEGIEPIIWIADPCIEHIVHESVHAIHHIARMTGIEVSKKSEEFFSYNIGYLSQEICNIHKLYDNSGKKD